MALQYHPDKNKDPLAEGKFKVCLIFFNFTTNCFKAKIIKIF